MSDHDDAARDVSRRAVMMTLALGLVAPATAALTVSAQAQAKRSKRDVMYQSQPNNNAACAGCQYFRRPNQCRLVEGNISPNGWCNLFAPSG